MQHETLTGMFVVVVLTAKLLLDHCADDSAMVCMGEIAVKQETLPAHSAAHIAAQVGWAAFDGHVDCGDTPAKQGTAWEKWS